eukprot:Hpha_TRINITY_DN13138_c0_g1::TRINITY_DN13138_c0_g1_i3::g.113354::m.113354
MAPKAAGHGAVRQLSVLTISWNVGECRPPPHLKQLFDSDRKPGIVVIALQEIDMSPSALLKEATSARTTWLDALGESVGNYVLIGARQLVGMLLAVYAAGEIHRQVTDTNVEVVRCGKGGRLGNKGGVSVSLAIRGTRFCFICVHFAAHMQNVQKRNEDFVRTIENLRFGKSRLSPLDHDAVFLIGDLNYRIELGVDECVQSIAEEKWGQLMQKDQLWRLYQEPAHPYSEWADTLADAKPCFAPTYKVVPGATNYDVEKKGKRRTPAWCDRILWRARQKQVPPRGTELAPVGSVRCEYFRRLEVLCSDHLPVVADFSVWVPALPSPLGGAGARLAGAAAIWTADRSVDYAPELPELIEEEIPADTPKPQRQRRRRSGAVAKLSNNPHALAAIAEIPAAAALTAEEEAWRTNSSTLSEDTPRAQTGFMTLLRALSDDGEDDDSDSADDDKAMESLRRSFLGASDAPSFVDDKAMESLRRSFLGASDAPSFVVLAEDSIKTEGGEGRSRHCDPHRSPRAARRPRTPPAPKGREEVGGKDGWTKKVAQPEAPAANHQRSVTPVPVAGPPPK